MLDPSEGRLVMTVSTSTMWETSGTVCRCDAYRGYLLTVSVLIRIPVVARAREKGDFSLTTVPEKPLAAALGPALRDLDR